MYKLLYIYEQYVWEALASNQECGERSHSRLAVNSDQNQGSFVCRGRGHSKLFQFRVDSHLKRFSTFFQYYLLKEKNWAQLKY